MQLAVYMWVKPHPKVILIKIKKVFISVLHAKQETIMCIRYKLWTLLLVLFSIYINKDLILDALNVNLLLDLHQYWDSFDSIKSPRATFWCFLHISNVFCFILVTFISFHCRSTSCQMFSLCDCLPCPNMLHLCVIVSSVYLVCNF